MEKNFRIRATKLLAVEGKDECNFFESLLRYERMDGVQLVDIGGKDKFQIELPLLTKVEGFRNVEVIGFIRDAEDLVADSAFNSVCETLRKNNLPVPVSINILADGRPKIGIFIMPDNQNCGRLEDLCLQTLEGRKIFDCIDDYILCFSSVMDQVEREKLNGPKARVLSYLASRAPIVNSLGLGAQNGYWDFSNDCFSEIKRFLHSLF
jgi:hypothetical protein